MQIESYRTRLEDFAESLNRELYRYYAGLKERLELVAVYSDYSDLFCTESIREVENGLENETFESRRKSLEKILALLFEGYLGLHAAPVQEEFCRSKAEQTARWEGERVPLKHLSSLLRAEPDALRRRKLGSEQAKALAEAAELAARLVQQQNAAAKALGFENYLEAWERISGNGYKTLAGAFAEALGRLQDKYLERIRVSFEGAPGIPLHEAGTWDIARWEELNEPQGIFPAAHLEAAVDATISEMAIRPERKDAISLDLESRPGKKPGAYCIPVRIPQEIRIVLAPGGGSGQYAALLHELGHAHHLAWTSSTLALEHRLAGDRAVAECYAFLLEHFVSEREWLARMCRFVKSDNFLRFQTLRRVFVIQRCMGRLRFGIEAYQGGSVADAPYHYSEIMRLQTGLRHLPEYWAADLSDSLASADYLRGWVLEAMLREFLRTKFGSAWNSSRSAANFLKEIWETGLLYRAEELCRELGMGSLEPGILADELWEGLQS